MNFVDSHSHLADPRFAPQLHQTLMECKTLGISSFVQGGVHRKDWELQLDLKEQAESLGLQIGCCFGVHPYTVTQIYLEDPATSVQRLEQEIDFLATQLKTAVARGETGLDYRPQYKRGSEELQKIAFKLQVEMALFARKPVVVHCVRAHDELLNTLHWGFDSSEIKNLRGVVHAFSGSWKKAKDFLDLGLFISVGGALCQPENQALREAIQRTPLENLLLESDTPDQKPPGWGHEFSDPTLILKLAEEVALSKQLPVREVLDKCSSNARQLFSL